MIDTPTRPLVFLTTKEVMERTALARSTLLERRKSDPEFPLPVKLGNGDARQTPIRWVESEIEEWMRKQVARRG